MIPQREKGIAFVIAAPSGTGKTTVCRSVLKREPQLRLSVSHTTRAPRAQDGEVDGVAYHFVSPSQFLELVRDDAFIEHAEYNDNRYGTSWEAVRQPVEAGHSVLLEIEVQGSRQIRKRLPDAKLIFLLPPSMEQLAQRLRGRGTDDDDTINRRMEIAVGELAAADIFHYAVVNDDLEEAVDQVLDIIRAECDDDCEDVLARHGCKRVLKLWRSQVDLD